MADKTAVTDRVESFTSYGAPACDICRSQSPDKRHDHAEFWPDTPIHYVRADCDSAVEFWGVTLCEHHDRPQNHPEDATHRVFNEPEYIGDEHRMNSAYEHNVVRVEVF